MLETIKKGSKSYEVPQSVRDAAKRGLEIRRKQPKSRKAGLDPREAGKQGIGSGVIRASDLMSGRVTEKTIRMMHRFFSRHRKNITLDPGKKPEEDNGYVSGLLWGGEPGMRFAAKMVKRFEQEKVAKGLMTLMGKAKVPEKYLEGLSEKEKKERKKEIKKRLKKQSHGDYKPLPGDDKAKTKPSKYTRTKLAAKVREEMEGNSDDEFLRATAKITGISKKILRKVHQRGAAAWATSGHRPGASQIAWSRARVYSFATGGKTQKTTDSDLWADHKKMSKAESSAACPVAAGNLKLNTKNRNKAIKAKHIKYGPLNVDEPGDYWKDIAEHWDTTEAAAKKSLCGNCVAFDISPRMDDCMPGQTSDDDGRLGYCWMHHFKCHSARSCYTWAKGGPITEDKVSMSWQEKAPKETIAKAVVGYVIKSFAGRVVLFKARKPDGKGWAPIASSKHGGWRRPKGNGFEYWYPNREAAVDAAKRHAQLAKRHTQEARLAARRGDDKAAKRGEHNAIEHTRHAQGSEEHAGPEKQKRGRKAQHSIVDYVQERPAKGTAIDRVSVELHRPIQSKGDKLDLTTHRINFQVTGRSASMTLVGEEGIQDFSLFFEKRVSRKDLEKVTKNLAREVRFKEGQPEFPSNSNIWKVELKGETEMETKYTGLSDRPVEEIRAEAYKKLAEAKELTVERLRQGLKQLGEPVRGTRDELVARWNEYKDKHPELAIAKSGGRIFIRRRG